jgi:hypothetical protein
MCRRLPRAHVRHKSFAGTLAEGGSASWLQPMALDAPSIKMWRIRND